MTSTNTRRRIAAFGISLIAGAGLAVAGGAAPAAASGTTAANNNRVVTANYHPRNHVRTTWIKVNDFDSKRQCERAGRRIDNHRRDVVDFRCIKDWDRDWSRGDWDRRGNDWNQGRRGFDNNNRNRNHNRHHRADYNLYVKVIWRR